MSILNTQTKLKSDYEVILPRPLDHQQKIIESPAKRKIIKAREVEEIAHADNLLEQVRDLQTRALNILEAAEGSGDLRVALGAIREARCNLELLGKLAGELQAGQVVNVLVTPEWTGGKKKTLNNICTVLDVGIGELFEFEKNQKEIFNIKK